MIFKIENFPIVLHPAPFEKIKTCHPWSSEPVGICITSSAFLAFSCQMDPTGQRKYNGSRFKDIFITTICSYRCALSTRTKLIYQSFVLRTCNSCVSKKKEQTLSTCSAYTSFSALCPKYDYFYCIGKAMLCCRIEKR